MLIDTHSHLNFKAYDNDRDEVIKRTQKEGVICIDVGTKYETSKRAVELAEKYKGIFAAIGMHPIHIKTNLLKLKLDSPPTNFELDGQVTKLNHKTNSKLVGGKEESAFTPLGEEFNKARYRDLVSDDNKKAEGPESHRRAEGPESHRRAEGPESHRRAEGPERSRRIVAIGEIGLDYYYRPKTNTKLEQFKEKQKQVFIEQLDLAKELNLPVIIHCRMAHDDVIKILEGYIGITGVIHCFTGNLEQAQKYMDLGFYIGINGIIFKFNIDEIIKKIPIDKILIETDCPYLTPPQEIGKRNEPVFIKYVLQKIAELRNEDYDKLAQITTENAKKLFKI